MQFKKSLDHLFHVAIISLGIFITIIILFCFSERSSNRQKASKGRLALQNFSSEGTSSSGDSYEDEIVSNNEESNRIPAISIGPICTNQSSSQNSSARVNQRGIWQIPADFYYYQKGQNRDQNQLGH